MMGVHASCPQQISGGETLGHRERMRGRQLITSFFSGGGSRSLAAYPLRVVYMTAKGSSDAAPVRMMVTVSKRHFKHAVDRNRVKRQVREAFRRHKQVLYDSLPADSHLLVAFIWLSDQHSPSANVEARVVGLLHRVAEKMKTNSEK